jgi:hypothetical protein
VTRGLVLGILLCSSVAAAVWFRPERKSIERSLVKREPTVAAPDHTYELALQHEAIRQLAIAVHVLGAECNPRRKYAPLHMPKGFDIEAIEIGGDEPASWRKHTGEVR